MSTDQNTGRVAVITGASSGIGEALRQELQPDISTRSSSG
jgi:NADP-dependent 3-hydroxy acid dehydrogenase YdfG